MSYRKYLLDMLNMFFPSRAKIIKLENPSVQSKVLSGTKVEGIGQIGDDVTKNPGMELINLDKI